MRNWQLKAIVAALTLGTAVSVGAQTSAADMSRSSTMMGRNPIECSHKTGIDLSNCVRALNNAPGGNATSQSRSMQSDRDSMRTNPRGSQSGSTSDTGNAANGAATGNAGAANGAGTAGATGASGGSTGTTGSTGQGGTGAGTGAGASGTGNAGAGGAAGGGAGTGGGTGGGGGGG